MKTINQQKNKNINPYYKMIFKKDTDIQKIREEINILKEKIEINKLKQSQIKYF